MIQKPLLITFLGFPGSGKTYFSKRLAEQLHAITFNTDALRVSMFYSLERIEQIRMQDRTRLYEDVFGAMNYATKQALKAGFTVIYDAHMTKREDRVRIETLAHEADATPLLVWIKTRRETALRRGQEREAEDDSNQYPAEKIVYLIDRFDDITDSPQYGENVIEINGEVPFEDQFISFQTQLDKSVISK